ncbi:hypothetical protein [Paenibacillus sp. R14(2021)]|nr:hypothetical protein [Paenibacillus sp. R14(2021)]
MTGRNNKPKKRGPESHPGRLDQYGSKLAEDSGTKPMQQDSGKNC